MDYIIVLLSSLVLSLVLTPIVRRIVLRIGIVDIPNESRWHRQATASMGGIAIFSSFLLVALLRVELKAELIVILVGSMMMFATGLLDDFFETSPKSKLAAQIPIAFATAYFGVVSKILPYSWMDISLTVFWIVGLTNALNLLDNMDGLSTGITIIAALSIFALSFQKGETGIALLCLALAGSCLGFLRYNFKPAKIFMGDCGSLFLGYTLATLSVLSGWQHSSPLASTFIAPVSIMAVPIFDTTLVTIVKLMESRLLPWRGGKDHSSHRLVSILKGKERCAVLVLYGIGILAGGLSLIVTKVGSSMSFLMSAVFVLGMIIFGVALAKVECHGKSGILAKDPDKLPRNVAKFLHHGK